MNKHGGYQGTDLIDFSVNLNPTVKPESIESLYQHSFHKILDYPEIDQLGFRRFLSKRLGCEPDELMIGNGATELIYLLAQALPVNKVGIFTPTYTEYRRAFEMVGKEVVSIPLVKENNFLPDWESMPRCDLYILCNPNNPTGTLIRELDHLLAQDALILIDESFMDFVENPVDITAPNLIHLRSLTKFYGLAGLRLGYIKAGSDVIQKLKRYQLPWSVNALALELIRPLMESVDFQEQTKNWLHTERKRFRDALPQLIGGEANFFFLHAKEESFEQLKAAGFYLRQCDDFIGLGPEYLRFCIHTPENNQRLIRVLKELV